MFNLKIIFYCVFIFFFRGLLCAQSLSFYHLTTYDGLSSNSVVSIAQDYRGFMWFGTAHGVNRYDGVNFKKYLHDSTDNATLSGDYISCILADSKKNIWFGSAGEGLNKLNIETNLLERISVSNSDEGISGGRVICLFEDREGGIWIGTTNGLNLLADSEKKIFTKFYANNLQGIANNFIQCIFEDDEGSIWIGTDNGLTRMKKRNNTWQFETFQNEPDNKSSLSANLVTSVVQDVSHRIWVGTNTDGLNLFDNTTGTFSRVAMPGVVGNSVRRMKSDREGNIWIGTSDGILKFDPLSQSGTLYQHVSTQQKSLSQNTITSIFNDAQGSVWVGSFFGGIDVTHPQQSNLFSNLRSGNTQFNICNDVVTGITEDNKHDLWIATEGGGLNYIDRKTGIVTCYKHDPQNSASLGRNLVIRPYKDREGDIWAGTTGGGLNLFNPVSRSFSHFIFDPANATTSYTEILYLLEDSQQRFWVGTQHGLKLFRKINHTLIPDTSEIISNMVSTAWISTVIEDSMHNIWVGTHTGIFLLKKDEKKFNLPKGLNIEAVCLYEDKKQHLWVGALSGGLIEYDPATGKIRHHTIAAGIPGSQVLTIQGDEQNNIWMATDIGLCRLNPEDSTLRHYSPGDGIIVGGSVRNSSYKAENGELFFGGPNGLISFFPEKIPISDNTAPLVFTSLRLLNSRAEANPDNRLLTKDISLTNKITFAYNQNAFTISFALLSYINPGKNKYAYKLDGVDEDWNLSGNNSVTYTYLPPGTYTLLIKGANSDGIWSKPTSLSIEILPPAWKTWWAYLIYLSVLVFTVFLLIRYFIRRERKKILPDTVR